LDRGRDDAVKSTSHNDLQYDFVIDSQGPIH